MARFLPGVVEAFGEATLFEESLLQVTDVLVYKVVGLVYKRKHCVGRDLRRSVFDVSGVCFVGAVRSVSEPAHNNRHRVIFAPFDKSSVPKKINVIA